MKKIALAALISMVFMGCYYDKADVVNPNAAFLPCDTTAVSYAATIAPIINANCTSCHGGNGSLGGGHIYDNYTNLSAYLAVNKSMLLSDINWTTNNMPKGESKLSACNINKITAWINQGMKNN